MILAPDDRPLAIDLFCGLGGWTDGLLAEGYRVQGFDVEAHEYDGERYPAELILADVLDLHGSRFADATLIVASPPCQEYSYMAMPWSKAKAKAAAIRADETGAELERLNRLFNACFRIQREASAAAGRHVPMVVENVRGAFPWVGRSRWNFGSFHLWGDVPALMPVAQRAVKAPGLGHGWKHPDDPRHTPSLDFTRLAGQKGAGGSWFGRDGRGQPANPSRGEAIGEGAKVGGDWFSDTQSLSWASSGSMARKAASARIAKIPLPLSQWIARTYRGDPCYTQYENGHSRMETRVAACPIRELTPDGSESVSSGHDLARQHPLLHTGRADATMTMTESPHG